MHVLNRVHGWLRPGGRVLDIHPEPEDARVEVRDGGGLTFIGPYTRPAIYQNIHVARDALAGMVVEGLFARERSVRFEVQYHFDTVDAWLAYRIERGTRLTRRLWRMRGRYWLVRQASCWSANRCAPPGMVSGTPPDRTLGDVFDQGRSEFTFAIGFGNMLLLLALVVKRQAGSGFGGRVTRV